MHSKDCLRTIVPDRISMISCIAVLLLAVTISDLEPIKCLPISTNATITTVTPQNVYLCLESGTPLETYRQQTKFMVIHAIVYLFSGLIASGLTLLSKRLFGRSSKSWSNLLTTAIQLLIAVHTQGDQFLLLGFGLASPQLYPINQVHCVLRPDETIITRVVVFCN